LVTQTLPHQLLPVTIPVGTSHPAEWSEASLVPVSKWSLLTASAQPRKLTAL